jgi:hypothetical protein
MEGTPTSGSSMTSVSLGLFARGSRRSSGGMGETEETARRRTLRRGCKGADDEDLENCVCRIMGKKGLELIREGSTLMTGIQQCYPLYHDFDVPVDMLLLDVTISELRNTKNLLLSTIKIANSLQSRNQNKMPAIVYQSKKVIL